MSEHSESDPEDSADEIASYEHRQYCKHLDGLRKRKRQNEDISNMINIGKIPKEQNAFKVIVESDRLSQASEKKIKQINKRFSLLEKDIDRLKEISDEKKRKSNDNIQAHKAMSSMIIGEIMKKYNTCREKANDMKSAFDKETTKIRNNEAREKTEVGNAKKELENILAMAKERFDETKREQEKAAEERSRLELEINNMKEKEIEEKDRLDRTNKYIEEQKDEINRMHINIRSLQQEHSELEREIEAEKIEMKSDETRVKRSIKNLEDMLDINKDQNAKMKNIEIMLITFVKTKEEYDKNIKVIQQFKTDKELEIRAEIKRMAETEILAENKMNVKMNELDTYLKNMQKIQQNKLKTMDRNIKVLTNKLEERKKAMEASCELMKVTQVDKEKEFDAEIQSMIKKLSEIKDNIEKKIKSLEEQRRVETEY